MKKNIYIVLFGLLLSMGAASCDNDSDLLFDETASQRKEGANTEYNDALKSSELGWLFQYFPEETQKYGGYNFVVKFNQHDSVTVWSEKMDGFDFTKPETSLYDVISYGGPVLTFNTYNSLMHEFANPSASEYLAKGGDYEFLIQSYQDGIMTVKGTKTGNTMSLIKMTETAEEYLTKSKAISDFTSGASFGTIIDGNAVNVFLTDHVFTFSYTEDDEVKFDEAPFIFTDKGIHFYEPITVLGTTAQDFILNTETNQFTSIDSDMAIAIIFAPVNLTLARWGIDTSVETDRSAAVKEAWDQAYIADANTWGEDLYSTVFMGLCSETFQDIGISFYSFTSSGSAYRAHYNLSFGGVLGHDDYLNVIKIDEGFNWTWYGHFEPFVNLITDNAPYAVEMDDADNPTEIKMTSVANPDVWFILR